MQFAIVTPEDTRWQALYDAFAPDGRDVFYAPAFAAHCQRTLYEDQAVRAAIAETDEGGFIYPFVQRGLDRVTGSDRAAGLADITSLYGLGGAITRGLSDPEIAAVHAQLRDYCQANGVICGFERIHPVLKDQRWIETCDRVLDVGETVIVDLTPDPDDLLAGFKHAARKAARKAIKSGVTVHVEENVQSLADFLRIYVGTMDRRDAGDFYYFPEHFFAEIFPALQGQAVYYYAVHQDRIVSCELVLVSDTFGHSFLGGTDRAAMEVAPNNLLKFEIMKDLRARGCRQFILGGGSQPGDGIFKYKLAFAPDGARPSIVGGHIYDPTAYDKLKTDLAGAGVTINPGRIQFYDPQ